jgi:hypothetical protein
MSGGSYNYLCYKEGVELFDMTEELEWMVTRLRGSYPDAADATQAILDTVNAIKEQLHELNRKAVWPIQRIWRQAEWCDSCDCGEEDVLEAVDGWRSDRPAPAPGGD